MALTYYIRSWDPRSTYPTNPQEGDICYTITLDQTWAPVGGVKDDNILKKEVYQNGAWVEQGGGGGSVETCEVTITNNTSTPMLNIYLSHILDDAGLVAIAMAAKMPSPTSSFAAILVDGKGRLTLPQSATAVLSGDIEQVGTTLSYEFTGDCSITLS